MKLITSICFAIVAVAFSRKTHHKTHTRRATILQDCKTGLLTLQKCDTNLTCMGTGSGDAGKCKYVDQYVGCTKSEECAYGKCWLIAREHGTGKPKGDETIPVRTQCLK
jgi:hypothetical protein